MPTTYTPGPRSRTVCDPEGNTVEVPADWELVPPGDPALSRRIKDGPHFVVQESRGRKVFSRGIWAPSAQVAELRADLERERASPEYARKLEAGRARREREEQDYRREFHDSILKFLRFAPVHAEIAEAMARRVTAHATPVGSGTVARTERIPVEQRAEAAVIAWMRHQTTMYDLMHISRSAGARREVRRELAEASRKLLTRYRNGQPPADGCPLQRALASPERPAEAPPSAKPSARPPLPKPRPAETTTAAPTAGEPGPAPASPRAGLFARLKKNLGK